MRPVIPRAAPLDGGAQPSSFMPSLARSCALAVACLVPWSSHAAPAATESFPERPVRVIVPHTPGGLVDTFTRYLAQNLATKWGRAVVVENRPGANQAIAAELVSKASPDGYTLLVGTQTGLVLNAIVRDDLPFDPVRDFAPITGLFTTPFYLVVHPKVQAHSVEELIALAKSRPGKLTYASIGVGSAHQLAGETFKTLTGTDILHVAYKGSAPAITDLLGGQVDMMFEGGASSLPNVRSGKLRALASTGPHRTADMPDLPTISETVPGFDLTVWIGLVAPAGTPQAVVDKINRDATEILKRPETTRQFSAVGIEVMPTTPTELAQRIHSEIPQWTQVMRAAGIRPQGGDK
ncbi:MAG: tripartite tricarboxylate transporter substrate binding protein [Pigmentiphaga sp.]|uniref:Bug family tripartite tricarboxylate transporter substrate binding protein n=1 Tax=Pigmentiphaga sp. TaxID=1977564 RepID=UPI0029B09AE6|nr:tripartite tricarboxylate transporter substrate binding protein [Pigmentiphaga sp.]MDX3907801.1 tripartite tricarboxylate transporter substrate binding protein [Pigmentiphaga sp.]